MRHHMGVSIAVLVMCLVSPFATCNESADPAAPDLFGISDRFRPHEPNYLISQQTDDDDRALEARYSFRFMLTGQNKDSDDPWRASSKPDCADILRCTQTYFKYTGEFDFYFGTRLSGPVISRVNNPALHVRTYQHRELLPGVLLRYVDFGIQHLSNGQVQDALLVRNGVPRAQSIFEMDPNSPFFDTISRGLDFISIESAFRLGRESNLTSSSGERCAASTRCTNVWIRLRPYYIHDDNPVVWGPSDYRTSEVADFDQLRVVVSRDWAFGGKKFGPEGVSVAVDWRAGETWLDGDSVDLSVTVPFRFSPLFSLPIYARVHRGPLNNLSNYSRSQNSFGIGVRLY